MSVRTGGGLAVMVSAPDSGLSGLGSSPVRDIVMSSLARHFTLTVPLSTQVYKWLPAKLMPAGDNGTKLS